MELVRFRKKGEEGNLYEGSRIKLISNQHGTYDANPVWGRYRENIIGTITSMPEPDNDYGEMIEVDWDNETQNSYYADDLELI